MDCVFCKIAAGEIPSKKLYEDDRVIAFYDTAPVAPVHFLIIPKQHIMQGAAEVSSDNSSIVAYIFEVIAKLVKENAFTSFRVVTNNGAGAGQTVSHLHFHVLAGDSLGEMV